MTERPDRPPLTWPEVVMISVLAVLAVGCVVALVGIIVSAVAS